MDGSRETREPLDVCSLAGSSAVYFVLFEIGSIGGTPRRCTPPPSPSSSARYLVARRSYEGDRGTTGVTKGSSVLHTHARARGIGWQKERNGHGGKYQRVERVPCRPVEYRLIASREGKLDPWRGRKVINLTSYEARL